LRERKKEEGKRKKFELHAALWNDWMANSKTFPFTAKLLVRNIRAKMQYTLPPTQSEAGQFPLPGRVFWRRYR
jgi:hypothetical protein